MAIKNFNVGIKAAIMHEGKLLFVKDAKGDFWDLPGGRMDDDEIIPETIARELQEELPNAAVESVGDIVCAFRVPEVTFQDGSGLILVVYKAEVSFPDGVVQLSDEHNESRWVALDEADELGSFVAKETAAALRKSTIA